MVQSQVWPEGSFSCQAEIPRVGRLFTETLTQPALSGSVTTCPCQSAVAFVDVKLMLGVMLIGLVERDPRLHVVESLESLE